MSSSQHFLIWQDCQFAALIVIFNLNDHTDLQFVTFRSRDGPFGTTESKTASFPETNRKQKFGNHKNTTCNTLLDNRQ